MQYSPETNDALYGVSGTVAVSTQSIEWFCYRGVATTGPWQVKCIGTLNDDMDRISDGQFFDREVR